MPELIDKKAVFAACLNRLKKFGAEVNKFGANFAVFDYEGQEVLLSEGGEFHSDTERLVQCTRSVLKQSEQGGIKHNSEIRIWQFEDFEGMLAVGLRQRETIAGVGLIDLGEASDGRDYLSSMLRIFAESFYFDNKVQSEVELVSGELAQTYEELVLLHKISTNMRVTGSVADYLQMACDSLTDIVNVEGIVVLLKENIDEERRLVIAAGSGLVDLDERQSGILYSRLLDELNSGKEALLDSDVEKPFKHEWPGNIRSVIAVPLYGKGKTGAYFTGTNQNSNSLMGLMAAFNRLDKDDFDSTDIKLFNSVANTSAVFLGNGVLFNDLKDLFLGSLKALTNTIDAKDPYTRGHSERVAFVSRWIAEKMLENKILKPYQVHKIYLAGLLHDIGKMGIAEMVLRKKGKLTEQEYNHIKMHPSIGAGILSEIKQMGEIVPGVLYHHERVDGKGYPDGLSGDQIPITGKIISLADSFDAMTSKRTYRDALTIEQALAEIELGLGTQFDEKVGRTFIRSDIYKLWDVLQDGFRGSSEGDKFSQFETIAVESLLE